MAASQYKATQMTPIDPNNMSKTSGALSVDGRMVGGDTRPPNMPKKGENPKNAMVDGPYGGKKPQS